MIESVSAGFLRLLFIHQNKCAVAVFVNDLDSAVLDEFVVKGFDAEIDRAHCAGEFAEILTVVLADCKIHQIVVAAEYTAAHLHIRGVDRNRLCIGILIELLLILIIQNLDAAGLLHRKRHLRCSAPHAVCITGILPCLLIFVEPDHVKDIGAAVAFKGAAVDIGNAALILALIPCLAGCGDAVELDDSVPGIRRGAVASECTAVCNKRA